MYIPYSYTRQANRHYPDSFWRSLLFFNLFRLSIGSIMLLAILSLTGRADWNDCLNLNCFSDTPGQSVQTTTNKNGTTAESVFIAGLFVLV